MYDLNQYPEGTIRWNIGGWKSVPAWSTMTFDLGVYPPLSPLPTFNFPVTVWEGWTFLVFDMMYQSKMVRQAGDWRSSYAVYNSIWTLTEHNPWVSWRVPMELPSGFTISGFYCNNSPEPQNMITRIHGLAVPPSEEALAFVQLRKSVDQLIAETQARKVPLDKSMLTYEEAEKIEAEALHRKLRRV